MNERREQDDLKTPFSFKLMIVLVVLYLGWRLVQGIIWVWGALF
jgi:hypothetical protein